MREYYLAKKINTYCLVLSLCNDNNTCILFSFKIKDMKLISYLFILLILFIAGCNSSKDVKGKANAVVAAPLTETYWKLIELNGATVADAVAGQRREIYLQLKSKENRATGNAGCNGYGGSYMLQPDSFGIRFTEIIRTEMACEGINLENDFFKVLEQVDSYYITGNLLQLNRARMAPLAKFIAVPQKK